MNKVNAAVAIRFALGCYFSQPVAIKPAEPKARKISYGSSLRHHFDRVRHDRKQAVA